MESSNALLRTQTNSSRIASSRLFRGRNKGTESLIGRVDELAKLDAAWSGAGKNNIITIVAWGGIGKTSLVAHWAAKKLAQPDYSGIERYFDWSFYSQGTRREGDATGASHTASADLFLKEALEFFGDPDLAASNAGAWRKGERLAQLICQRRTLLIFDGLEPLQDAKTGELRDDGLCSLLRGLAARNHGLCLITTRQHLPDLVTWHLTTAPEWELACLTDEAGADLLTNLGVNGTDTEKRDLSARVRGHALSITLLGRYLKRAHHGDIRRVDRVDFQKVNEKEQGGYAFRVIAAYERWFEENKCHPELAILRMLGLFDRPATPDCLAALRNPPIPGLTDAIASLTEDDWNEAVTHLVELDLVEEHAWERQHIVGYNENKARVFWREYQERGAIAYLGPPQPSDILEPQFGIRHSLDGHALLREFFAKRVQQTAATGWKAAHSRLFDHLRTVVPYWPEGLDGLQPLYQSITHGCEAGRYEEARVEVFRDRIFRGVSGTHPYYSTNILGAHGADLAAGSCFFVSLWNQPAPELPEASQAWLLGNVAHDLVALGRPTEAVGPMQAAFLLVTKYENWQNAARIGINLSELQLTLGDVFGAVRYAKDAHAFAERSGDGFMRETTRAHLADVLHQAGSRKDALTHFREAEAVQTKRRPKYPLMGSLCGFQFCDLQLASPEIQAWRQILHLDYDPSIVKSIVSACLSVEERAAQTLEWTSRLKLGLLGIALDHLTLGRAALYRAIFEHAELNDLQSSLEHLDTAIHGLRGSERSRAPRALLTRAWLRFLTCARTSPESAQADLDEAWEIAERGPMKLFLADIHLQRARLFFREKSYPWKSPQDDLAAAEKLINDCGYHRRDEELADAKLAILGK